MKVFVNGEVAVLNGGIHKQVSRQKIVNFCIDTIMDTTEQRIRSLSKRETEAYLIMSWIVNLNQIQILQNNNVKFYMLGWTAAGGITIEASNELIAMLKED